MFSFIAMLIAVLAVVMGYSGARRFVRDRLRYVDGAQKGTAPASANDGAECGNWSSNLYASTSGSTVSFV